MGSLAEDLSNPKSSLNEFSDLCIRVLQHIPDVISEKVPVRDGYVINVSNIAGQKKFVRPINTNLFFDNPDNFNHAFIELNSLLDGIKNGNRNFNEADHLLINRTLYTIQQSIGAGLDLFLNPNSARKHVGNRFEELLRTIIHHLGVANKKITFVIPYESEEGEKLYRCETDLIISPSSKVTSTTNKLAKNEVVLSFKTTSKDRMGKIFLDKMLMERFSGHQVKVAGIFLNDVQRKGEGNISYTLVSGLFMVYTKFLTRLDGIYFLDPPPNAYLNPYKDHISPFSEFVINDIWELLS
ncbi:MAG TPA: hypothetical protein VKA34_16460 [Balneolales bacterium]|nr:hypothetical protein [Balneolales bacterium]